LNIDELTENYKHVVAELREDCTHKETEPIEYFQFVGETISAYRCKRCGLYVNRRDRDDKKQVWIDNISNKTFINLKRLNGDQLVTFI